MNFGSFYRAMDPDDVIRNDGLEYVREGNYAFLITEITGGMHPGSEKIGPCPTIRVTALVDTEQGLVQTGFTLFLSRVLEWKLSQFFRCIGLKKAGEPMRMQWDDVVGCTGRARFRPESYFDDRLRKRTALNPVEFFDAPEAAGGKETEDTS